MLVKRFVFILVLVISFSSIHAYAQVSLSQIHPDVEKLLAQTSEPEGVVFDIETLDTQALSSLGTYVKQQIQLIKQKYPDVDIAVVSHGTEEFALQKQAASDNLELHSLFNQLANDNDVSIHVCGAVAGLKGLNREDFPDFVSYSESGMAQLNDYKALGYSVIKIQQLNQQQRETLFKKPEQFIR